MTTTLQNSIWPNTDGNLGNIKVQIPDGVDVKWPDGDALIGNFVYKEGKLVGFVDTKALAVNDSKTTTINYDYTDIELPFTEGIMTINRGPRSKYFIVKYSPANGEEELVLIRFEDMDEETKTMFRSATKVIDNVLYDANDNVIGEFNTNRIETGSNLDLEAGETTDGNPIDALYCSMDLETSNIKEYVISEFSSDLSNLKNGIAMFYCCVGLTRFNADLSSLTDGFYMFSHCENLSSFDSDLSSLTIGAEMFLSCYSLTSFDSDLSNLVDGSAMFENCENLTTFGSDLSSLKWGDSMFYGCSNLSSFNYNLPNLEDGNNMFSYCNFTSFSSQMPNLRTGDYMFHQTSNLTSFGSDLSRVYSANEMFSGCINLSSFSSDLSSLEYASGMFGGCKLDTTSVENIASTIKDITALDIEEWGFGEIKIGILSSAPSDDEVEAFNTIVAKGWTVYVDAGDGDSLQWDPTSLIPIDGEKTTTPSPFYAKPVPATEKTAKYIDENGNYFNIVGGNYIYGDDLSTYGMFLNEADAAANMRLTKIEKQRKRRFQLS